jgi:hypothetical protein
VLYLATAKIVGVGFLLVPIPLAIVLLVRGSRSKRLDRAWLMGACVTFVPAAWAVAVGTRLTPCAVDGCVPHSEADRLLLAAPSVPLVIAGLFLITRGQAVVGKGMIAVAEVLLLVAVWKTVQVGSIFIVALLVMEVAYEVVAGGWLRREGLAAGGDDGTAPASGATTAG